MPVCGEGRIWGHQQVSPIYGILKEDARRGQVRSYYWPSPSGHPVVSCPVLHRLLKDCFRRSPSSSNKQAASNPAEEYLLRLKEAEYYASQPPTGSGFSGSQKGLLEKILPDIIRDLRFNWEPDSRLASFCRWLNDLIDVGFIPEGVTINEAASWLGLPEPHPHFISFRNQVGPRLASTIKARLLQIKEPHNYTHYGVLVEQTTSSQVNIIVAFSSRHLFCSHFHEAWPNRARLSLS